MKLTVYRIRKMYGYKFSCRQHLILPSKALLKAVADVVNSFLNLEQRATMEILNGELYVWIEPTDVVIKIDQKPFRFGVVFQLDKDKKEAVSREVDNFFGILKKLGCQSPLLSIAGERKELAIEQAGHLFLGSLAVWLRARDERWLAETLAHILHGR